MNVSLAVEIRASPLVEREGSSFIDSARISLSLSLSLSARDDPEATRIDDYASDRRRQVNLAAIFNADARVINIEASTLNTHAHARENECRINCGRHRMKSRGLFELASGDDTRHAIPELTQRKYR